MVDYEKEILIFLVEGYRKSKKDDGTNQITKRTQIKPTKLYKGYNRNDGDMDQIDAINMATENLREKGFLTFEMNGFSNEILAIYLVDEKVDEAEKYLSEKYQYQSKHDKLQYVEQMIGKYAQHSTIANLECEKLKDSLEKNRVPANYLQTEDILKALAFIENNQKLLYIREASMLIYGSSKYFEENSLDSVCRIIRNYLKRPCEEHEMLDEILSEYGILKEKQKICLKGDITFVKKGEKFELKIFTDGIEFYTDELSDISQVIINSRKFVTVENKTSYLRCRENDTVYFYLGGYANRFQRNFLRKIYIDNPNVEYRHFGDIDAGGFFIHEHLCRMTGIQFKLEHMSKKELQDENYKFCQQKLTTNDRRRLQILLKIDIYQEVVEYMLEHNAKLEQEIVSYSLSGALSD